MKRSTFAKYYSPSFLIRRWTYCSLPLWMIRNPSLNFIVIIILHTFFAIWYGTCMNMPHVTRRLRYLELFNEGLFSLLLYESFLMTDLAANAT